MCSSIQHFLQTIIDSRIGGRDYTSTDDQGSFIHAWLSVRPYLEWMSPTVQKQLMILELKRVSVLNWAYTGTDLETFRQNGLATGGWASFFLSIVSRDKTLSIETHVVPGNEIKSPLLFALRNGLGSTRYHQSFRRRGLEPACTSTYLRHHY